MSSVINGLLNNLPTNSIHDLTMLISEAYKKASIDASLIQNPRMRSQQLSEFQRHHVDTAFETWILGLPQNIAKMRIGRTSRKSYDYINPICCEVALTIKRSPCREAKLRPCEFRENLSHSNVGWLDEQFKPKVDKLPHVVFLHGPKEKHSDELGFIRLVLPDPEIQGFLEEKYLPLVQVSSIHPQAVMPESILEDAKPTPKRKKRFATQAG